jgi:hypothetical protein
MRELLDLTSFRDQARRARLAMTVTPHAAAVRPVRCGSCQAIGQSSRRQRGLE